MKLIIVVFAFKLFSSAFATVPINGTCPPSPCDDVRLNISIKQLEGIWYPQANVGHDFEQATRCSYFNLTAVGDYALRIERKAFIIEENEYQTDVSEITVTDDGFILMDQRIGQVLIPFFNHIVVLTEEYLVSSICYECGLYTKEDSGIIGRVWTRLQQPSCETREEAINEVIKCGIPKDALAEESHDDCNIC